MFYQKSSEGYTRVFEGVLLKTLVYGERTLLCEIRFEKGGSVPPHHHLHEQTGYLVQGRVRFVVGGETLFFGPGDSWNIPSNVVHSAEALEEALIIEVFSPMREDYLPAALASRKG